MLAYKGFNSNLTCTMGKGTFQYEQGVKYTEENAHCGADGFHATDDPLGVLSYQCHLVSIAYLKWLDFQ